MDWLTENAVSLIGAFAAIWAAVVSTWQAIVNRPKRPPPMIHTELSHSPDTWPGWLDLFCTITTDQPAAAEILSVRAKSPAGQKIVWIEQNGEDNLYGGRGWSIHPPTDAGNTTSLPGITATSRPSHVSLRLYRATGGEPTALEFRYRWADERQRIRFLTIIT